MKNVINLLNRATIAYHQGEPFLSDDEYDALVDKFEDVPFTEGKIRKKAIHLFPMYSLQKVFDEDETPSTMQGIYTLQGETIESAKLDGAAISLLYEDGSLVKGITRGDGIEGEDITDKVYLIPSIPHCITGKGKIQITGEIVVAKEIENARNFASGALHTKSNKEFIEEKANHLIFIAYGIQPFRYSTYLEDMEGLEACYGFLTILDTEYCEKFFRTDGTVFRINNNTDFNNLGYTAKHPRGAYARKLSSDVAIEETPLLDVTWQVGRTGAVTPVAHFEEIIIDDARINRATLHNAGFLQNMDLEIGDLILVTRSGGIIPKVLGKA